MAPRKRAPWVGGENPVSQETNLVRPLRNMTPGQRKEELKDSPSKKAVAPRKLSPLAGETNPRPVKKAATRKALQTAEVREPTNKELKRGVTSVSTAPKSTRKRKAKTPSLPKRGQIAKINGQTVRVSESNIGEATKSKLTTKLPTAGKEEMLPRTGPRVPLEQPKGGVKPRSFINESKPKGEQVVGKLEGFGGKVHDVAPKIWDAIGHLDAMRGLKEGSKEHNQRYVWFHKAHKELRTAANKPVHDILSFAHKVYMTPDYPEKDTHINHLKDALSERISIARGMESRRAGAQAAATKKGDTSGS